MHTEELYCAHAIEMSWPWGIPYACMHACMPDGRQTSCKHRSMYLNVIELYNLQSGVDDGDVVPPSGGPRRGWLRQRVVSEHAGQARLGAQLEPGGGADLVPLAEVSFEVKSLDSGRGKASALSEGTSAGPARGLVIARRRQMLSAGVLTACSSSQQQEEQQQRHKSRPQMGRANCNCNCRRHFRFQGLQASKMIALN